MEYKPRLTASGKIKSSRTDTFEITIIGLLTKRAHMFNEARGLRERMGELSNDVAALDRVLATLGYTGELDAIMPQLQPERMFNNGELMRFCLREVRESGPVTSREIARKIIASRGENTEDRKHLEAVISSVSRCLRKERDAGRVVGTRARGKAILWEAVTPPHHAASTPPNSG